MSIYRRYPRFCLLVAVVLGVTAGWFQGTRQAPRLQASGGLDRWDDRAVVAGPVGIEGSKQNMTMTHDAIYYLNYHLGTLLAAIPDYKVTANGARVLSQFAQRDLMKDFDIKPGMSPHFLMTTASLGLKSEGWSPLFVFETESGQVATYRIVRQMSANSDAPRFDLVELRKDPRLAHRSAQAVAR
jgi:hypothetical protein